MSETRHCKACGVIAPDGPLRYEWDVHLDKEDPAKRPLPLSCSDECRDSMGYTRRKPVVEPKKQLNLEDLMDFLDE